MRIGHTDCTAERVQQSDHSPGLIKDDEDLAKIIYHRDQIDFETGELKPGAFSMTDLMTRGLSLVRLRHITVEELQRRGEEFAARRDENRLQGVGVASAGQVRSLRGAEGRQALCVIDDGKPDFRAHAIAIRSADQDRPTLMKVRGVLMGLFAPVRAIDEAIADRQ
jgi:hypothetical protein